MTKKKHLNQRQHQRIAANQDRRLARAQNKTNKPELDSDLLTEAEHGLVISRFGQHADIEDSSGQIFRCNIRRTVNSLVTGDKVVFRRTKVPGGGPEGVVEAVAERESVLLRPDFYDGLKPVAANIDLMIIVSAVLPAFSLNIVDRYLIAAEAMHIKPLLLLNKIDLLTEEQRAEVDQQLAIYQKIGYEFLLLSAKTGEGTAQLDAYLKQGVSIFVGQSGVGKSSLVNNLLPDISAETREVSENSGLGQHTTTTARLYHLPDGGDLIDSPGIREFALWHLEPEQIALGYPEFKDWLGRCKFRDCKHLNDPGCALQHAVSIGEIHPERFANYHKILLSMAQDKPNYFQP
ncbi:MULTISPECIES: small ribosomal subunit biogenesis GTPase RsgA [Rheinheimera]|uniref:Small ribosomal subunit biogenesis GTPase RsgA n=1 Tax=Rheinheimera tangshanensis TaxID=400153 RepID=A0A5C8M0U3_9GAMM|nr:MULTISPECIES: small ribosomal subunit biogenesis GTPase RsgA [Rheinheimera]KOO58910.1 GTPase RsgA [Rheinheimera sp. KL1]MBP8228026.1 small ribosomal subunit biogenesis GTPase RsgA [Rheinheimera sp.]TXK83111.1 small ribosomal subunit biogenesis GTPase RsgA [Rheinheimera tangshanensis]GGM46214.1 putative ribosome biogenesis GTPase RsgA [Rheinheimera tangshanensis]